MLALGSAWRRGCKGWLVAVWLLAFPCGPGGAASGWAQSVDVAAKYKALPPEGMEVDAAVLAELKSVTVELRRDLDRVASRSPDGAAWRPDVDVFIRAVEMAVAQKLFYQPRDIATAQKMLEVARRRLDAATRGVRGVPLLAVGSGGEHSARLLVGGFVSAIDRSVQPYGVVLPPGFDPAATKRWRLDVWLHGRGDTHTEVPFLNERLSGLGTFPSDEAITLHPFGRHCNAFKFAGEVDVYEAIEHVSQRFAVDPVKTAIRGFSMGGAGCWHLAAHNSGRWFAANPGAGFVDTVRYQGWDQTGTPYDPGDWGRRLMLWYDVPPWVENLGNTRVIAYSGENDKQRQAGDLMAQAASATGIEMTHVIGAGMGHKIDDVSADTIERQLAQWASEADGGYRKKVHWVTHTLRYPQIDWLSVQGMKRHWHRASVTAELAEPAAVRLTTDNVDRVRLDFTRLGWPLASGDSRIEIDGQIFGGPKVTQGQPVVIDLVLEDDQWFEVDPDGEPETGLRKRPGLQGPIDDAFTAPFLFVLPSRPCRHGIVERFVQSESQHARDSWQKIMRGDDRVVIDTELTADQIASYNLVCFGDFTGNRYLASIAPGLPIVWKDDKIVVGDASFDAASHAVAMVYPNPKNPKRYVVVNSGMTFREFSNATNSRQIAMLPDWAVIDVSQPADGIFPGRIAAADFFDESWRVK
jgi:dienelactone hydrolase